jgi:hypothetical protein
LGQGADAGADLQYLIVRSKREGLEDRRAVACVDQEVLPQVLAQAHPKTPSYPAHDGRVCEVG